MITHYKIIYTDVATDDLEAKAEYISTQLNSPQTAYKWYMGIRREIQENLSTFPYKYREYDSLGERLFVSRTDLVLYSVDDAAGIVYIESVHTRGKDLSDLIN